MSLLPLTAPLRTSEFADIVRRSRRRSAQLIVDPRRAAPLRVWSEAESRRRLAEHPVSPELPLLYRLLRPVTHQNGLALAFADQDGRVLDVFGGPEAIRQATLAGLVPGADWSEAAAGTNGIGTAAAAGGPVRVAGREHYAPQARNLICWAAPIRWPDTGRTAGVANLSAFPRSTVSTSGLEISLLLAAIYAVELRLADRRQGAHREAASAHLSVLGADRATMHTGLGQVSLSQRHSEIVLLLTWHQDGLGASKLATMLHDERAGAAPVRAEMRRLRVVLTRAGVAMRSQPYALADPVETDAAKVLGLLDQGDLTRAVRHYAGPALPGSVAPGVVAIRREMHFRIRRAVLASGDPGATWALAQVPGHEDDVGLWQQCVRQTPADSPRHVRAVAQLERIDSELGL